MSMQILSHTPRWVFVLFTVLLLLGLSQLAGRRAGLRRVSILPLAMLAWSLYGTLAAFAAQPVVLLGWLGALAAACAAVATRPLPAGTAYDPATRRFALTGSAWPLVLMMGIFFTRYTVGVLLAMSPGLASDSGFGWTVASLYGMLSGVFLGRALRLWKLALPTLAQAPSLRAA
ncbi:DUF6622 family protein [Ideonella sp.]|uniref:DUF6622 family protein n=1 Tax=Ideonella sp. TaxID=1929293 RepID=UPI002B46533A|nr:DUF6622 family protein [Ideonella sp.]HJV69013.1 DUF6622 family protein [Ideonella sp.]